jgi:putative spermidine/putrescine transport system ATP-binding protein
MGGSMEPALNTHVAVTGLSKRFGAANVLDRVDLAVERGALVTLLGPSGCGKTTLLRLIAGLIAPDEGSIAIGGVDVTRTPPHKRNVGVVFQNYALFPHLRVAGNVGFGLQGRGLGRAEIAVKVQRALALVQMDRFGDRPVRALSGGQQQRVALARALAVEPSVLLFDEALSALDRNLRETMQVELRRLLKDLGATAVFVTHDQDEALTMSDKVAVMNAGRIEQFDEPVRLYERPRSLFATRFVGVSSELRGTVAARDGGRLRVDTPQGPVMAEGDLPSGAAAVVSTRPENIAIGAGEGPDRNRIEGRVRRVTFQGSRTRIAVDVGAGTDFMVEIGGIFALPVPGDVVVLSWAASRSFVFADVRQAA